MKKITFKIVASVFTLMAQIVYEKRSYDVVRLQVLSNLVTASALNYALSVGLPFWKFLTGRYFIYTYLFTCRCCCCCRVVKFGKIEKFKKEIIGEMLLDNDTRDSFTKYCLEGKVSHNLNIELKKEHWKKISEKIVKKKGGELKQKSRNKNRFLSSLSNIGKKLLDASKIKSGKNRSKGTSGKKSENEKFEMIQKPVTPLRGNQIYPLRYDEVNDNMKEKSSVTSKEKIEHKLMKDRDDDPSPEVHDSEKLPIMYSRNKFGLSPTTTKKVGNENNDNILNGSLNKSDISSTQHNEAPFSIQRSQAKKISLIQNSDQLLNKVVLNINEEAKKPKDYKGPSLIFGERKKENIKRRLREEFTKYVLGREKIVETSKMVDLGSLEEDLYSSLLIQFSFICFFTPYLIFSGLISYIINIIVIILTINLYTKVTRRPISRRVTNIGIWNKLYSIVGFLGIVFNAFAISVAGVEQDLISQSVLKLLPFSSSSSPAIYEIQNLIMIAKFVLSIIIPSLPKWIDNKLTREKLIRERERKKNSKVLSRLAKDKLEKRLREEGKVFSDKKMKKSQEMDESLFKEKVEAKNSILESDDSRSLKYFFENDLKLVDFENLEYRLSSKIGNKVVIPKPVVKVDKEKGNRKG